MPHTIDINWAFFPFSSINNGDAFDFMESNHGIYTWIWNDKHSLQRIIYIGQTTKNFLTRMLAHIENQITLKYYINNVPLGLDFYEYLALNFCGKPKSRIGNSDLIHYEGRQRIKMLCPDIYTKNIRYLNNCIFGFGVIDPATYVDKKDFSMEIEGRMLELLNSHFFNHQNIYARYAGAKSNDTFFGKISRRPSDDFELRHSLLKESEMPFPSDYCHLGLIRN
ncbi:hypothetical protein [Fundidesulfovibrio agrisoli]|uniref:hypothetical protein n=1 Tax=Fundidesulfovibrio agrisoli TaxID=2922717 RepID=UPI001FAD94F6|nr:hypothetical protein [Fundidesulfovibrio agrisoli]